MLAATECCQKFSQIFSSSTKLLSKVKVSLKFPETETDDELAQTDARLRDYHQLNRRYQQVEIVRFRDSYLNRSVKMRNNFTNLIARLSPSVKVLKIDNCHILRNDLVSLLVSFEVLRECYLTNLMLADDLAEPDNENFNVVWLNLKQLHLKNCDFFCLLLFKSNDNLESLEICNPAYVRTDVEELENFLLKQTNLKSLKLREFRFNSTYSTGRLGSVPFQLENLSLNNVIWDIVEHCEAFMKSQKSLRKLELKSFHKWITPYESNFLWFSSVMRHFFTCNPRLTSLTIDTKFSFLQNLKDNEFLTDVINNKIEEIIYCKSGEDKTELLKIFTRMFPKVKSLLFINNSRDSSGLLQHIQLFKELEVLKLMVTPKSLVNFQLGTNKLVNFKFRALNEEKSCDKLIDIFTQNPSLQIVSLSIEPLTIEEITEILICLGSTLESLNITDLHLNPTEAELFTQNFPRLQHIRSDYRGLSKDVIDILANANIKFTVVDEPFRFD